jgi:hypothetical protein
MDQSDLKLSLVKNVSVDMVGEVMPCVEEDYPSKVIRKQQLARGFLGATMNKIGATC